MQKRKLVFLALLLTFSYWLIWGHKTQITEPAPSIRSSPVATPKSRADVWRASGNRVESTQIQRVFEAVEATNRDIEFWGRVVDQNGRPLDQVRVDYSFTTEHGTMAGLAWGAQGIEAGGLVTEANGEFHISGKRGHILEIKRLLKQGYRRLERGVTSFNYHGDQPEGRFVPYKKMPVVFAMVKSDALVGATCRGGFLGDQLRLPCDGTPVRWNLRTGKLDTAGELAIRFNREPKVLPPDSAKLEDWSLEMKISGGGLVVASPSELVYEAPEGGYETSLTFSKVQRVRGMEEPAFYFKTADNLFGRLGLLLYPDDQGSTTRLLIRSWLNNSGGRLVEADGDPTLSK